MAHPHIVSDILEVGEKDRRHFKFPGQSTITDAEESKVPDVSQLRSMEVATKPRPLTRTRSSGPKARRSRLLPLEAKPQNVAQCKTAREKLIYAMRKLKLNDKWRIKNTTNAKVGVVKHVDEENV